MMSNYDDPWRRLIDPARDGSSAFTVALLVGQASAWAGWAASVWALYAPAAPLAAAASRPASPVAERLLHFAAFAAPFAIVGLTWGPRAGAATRARALRDPTLPEVCVSERGTDGLLDSLRVAVERWRDRRVDPIGAIAVLLIGPLLLFCAAFAANASSASERALAPLFGAWCVAAFVSWKGGISLRASLFAASESSEWGRLWAREAAGAALKFGVAYLGGASLALWLELLRGRDSVAMPALPSCWLVLECFAIRSRRARLEECWGDAAEEALRRDIERVAERGGFKG